MGSFRFRAPGKIYFSDRLLARRIVLIDHRAGAHLPPPRGLTAVFKPPRGTLRRLQSKESSPDLFSWDQLVSNDFNLSEACLGMEADSVTIVPPS